MIGMANILSMHWHDVHPLCCLSRAGPGDGTAGAGGASDLCLQQGVWVRPPLAELAGLIECARPRSAPAYNIDTQALIVTSS